MRTSELAFLFGEYIQLYTADMVDVVLEEGDFSDELLRQSVEIQVNLGCSVELDQVKSELLSVAELIKTDAQYLLETDPATDSLQEIVMCFPGIYVLMCQRYAHVLFKKGVPVFPRYLSEHAHSVTGIDIHPGAQLGHHVAIDHGTGIVIGETTIIGNYVRLYHNVSLGNLSVKKEQEGQKRHPTIEDKVTVYAGAIILGGETVIGEGSTIGGGAVVTKSVKPHSLVLTENTTSYYDKREKNIYDNHIITHR